MRLPKILLYLRCTSSPFVACAVVAAYNSAVPTHVVIVANDTDSAAQ
jgi:hypothetical protein